MTEEASMDAMQKLRSEVALSPQPSTDDVRSAKSVPQTQTPNYLHLDPGSQRRASGITAKSLCLCLALLVAFVAVRIHIRYDIKQLYKLYSSGSDPHRNIYYNPKPGVVSEEDAFVKPLIGRKGELGGVFDLRATVWVKDNGTPSQTQWQGNSETIIFTDTVFRGVTLRDNRLRTEIQLQIPTQIFQNTPLQETDLRASFILVPASPSLLDDAVYFNTINGENLTLQPVRSYPLESVSSLQDEIVDAYGISIPLLGFYPTQLICNISQPAADVDLDASSNANSTIQILQGHPHIITRTFLTVADTTVLYDNIGYDKMHVLLRRAKTRCQRPGHNLPKNICTRNFPIHGNFETKLRVRIGDGESMKQGWAYAPFMSVIDNAWGPLDLVPAPLNQDVCPPAERTSSNKPFMNVTWHITYSGRTPFKLVYTNVLSNATAYNMTTTTEEKTLLQSQSAVRQGIIGNPYSDNYHPRRQAILDFLAPKLGYLNTVMTTHYFLVIRTTAGLSTLGTTLRGSLYLLDHIIAEVVRAKYDNYTVYSLVWGVLRRAGSQFTALLMLKAVTRAKLDWIGQGSYRAFPRIRFFPPTRRERASQRLESRITWPMVFGVFCLLDFIQIFIPVGDLSVQQPDTIVPRKLFPLEVHHLYIAKYFLNPASDISVLLQLVHNYRSKTFAGNHKVAVSAMLLSTLFDEASRSSAVVGQIYVQQGYDGGLLSRHGLRFMIALQVWLYPAVPQTDEEMD